MKLLAFELATEACSVAVWIDGEVHERFEIAPRRHAEIALPWADAMLAEAGIARAQLDAIAVGRGPGAFTGVRLAIAIGQGIALALERPIFAVSTLAALALAAVPAGDDAQQEQRVLASIDARMGEVYVGAFRVHDGDATLIGSEAVLAPDAVVLPDGDAGWLATGTGFAAADGALREHLAAQLARVDAEALPRAGDVARLAAKMSLRGEASAPERVEPAYLRNQVALTIAEQKALRAQKERN
ncbi:tRNA (adenosine(37)-N6)-threonylcarbamoyltransferase complex dimerization subunit type 1 TsaB [Lysobacter sp. A03]|uniref:tRNA (adenosine(37)-N6)-threonylcarbamoyltransferase complex dimerization subunit type 1 TsaB n=1 Tax=Lysobacter sp. A03 TaxID=1199154 RepID=UPI0005B6CDE1|nr:tRNA (adenosine(37)-N6)-threonylcarbamoyltransferase complex dimerization subunit type 1 TsaB [Lysobacter sp. A03]KIQ97900.1 TsaB protein, required for threonylcarbamoyladenosine (t(6)A) formation in tRNA [Lysobacter sp. A03]